MPTLALVAAARLAILVVPLGNVEREHVELAAGALVLQYGADVRIAPPRALPSEAYDPKSNRYVALRLIAEIRPPSRWRRLTLEEPKLFRDRPAGTFAAPPPEPRVLVLGVTEARLVGARGERVAGLAQRDEAAVISGSHTDAVASLAIHEVGHLLGLDHHDGEPCAMRERDDVPYLCRRCAARALERVRGLDAFDPSLP